MDQDCVYVDYGAGAGAKCTMLCLRVCVCVYNVMLTCVRVYNVMFACVRVYNVMFACVRVYKLMYACVRVYEETRPSVLLIPTCVFAAVFFSPSASRYLTSSGDGDQRAFSPQ